MRPLIARIGARPTVDWLWTVGHWEEDTTPMEEGDPDFVALAPALAPETDSAAGQGPGISLAFALPISPRPVLRAIDPADGFLLGATCVCGIPFIEDSVPDRPADRRRAIAAVRRVRDPVLAPVRAACLATLERSE